jgi:hypothetical protein
VDINRRCGDQPHGDVPAIASDEGVDINRRCGDQAHGDAPAVASDEEMGIDRRRPISIDSRGSNNVDIEECKSLQIDRDGEHRIAAEDVEEPEVNKEIILLPTIIPECTAIV